MATLGELRATILDDLIDSRLTNSQVNRAINDAIGFYEKKEFYFNVPTPNFTLNMVSGQEYYDDAPIPDMVRVVYIQSSTPDPRLLSPVDDAVISNAQNGSVEGIPYMFSYISQQIRLFPIPSSSDAMTVQAVVKASNLASDSASNVWTTEAEELIRQSAKRRLALNILHDSELAGQVLPMEQEAYDALLAESRRRFPQTKLYSPPDLSMQWNNTQQGWQGQY